MRRTSSLYPKNKIATSLAMFQLPLKNNNSFSSEKNSLNNTNRRTAFPKSKNIKKMIEEINLTNLNPPKIIRKEQSNLYSYQNLPLEEKKKNRNYYENISLLNKHIDELECKLNNNCITSQNTNNIINDELIRLRQENKELKKFKEKVYAFSMKYDELNKDIFNCLKSIEKIVQIFTNNSPQFEYEKSNLNKISINFKSILDNLTNYINLKQDEYNTLLIEKENEIEKLKNKFNYTDAENFSNRLKTCKNYENRNKSNEYSIINKANEFKSPDQTNCFYKIYKTNEFNLGKNKQKNEIKNSYDNF